MFQINYYHKMVDAPGYFQNKFIFQHLYCLAPFANGDLLRSPGIVAVVVDESGTNAKSGCPSRVDQSSCVFIFHGAIN
jgi:hypothetical protein